MSDINITGTGKVIEKLNRYSAQAGDKILTNALEKASLYLVNKLKAAAPVNKTPSKQFPAGRLKNSFFFKTSKFNRLHINNSIGFYVRPLEKGKKEKFVDGRYGDKKDAYYVKFVENGYEVKGRGAIGRRRIGASGLRSGRKTVASGKVVAGTRFIEKTVDRNKSTVSNIVKDIINTESDRLKKELGL